MSNPDNYQNKRDPDNSTALSFDDFKKTLGSMAYIYTDDQIKHIWLLFDKMADTLFDRWLKRRNAHNV